MEERSVRFRRHVFKCSPVVSVLIAIGTAGAFRGLVIAQLPSDTDNVDRNNASNHRFESQLRDRGERPVKKVSGVGSKR